MKFEKFSALLLQQGFVDKPKFDSFITSCTLQPVMKPDADGLLFGNIHYTATFVLERINNTKSAELFAFTLAWLADHDDNRTTFDLGDPALQVDIITADLAEVEIDIDFVDPLHLVRDPAGAIPYGGERWGFGDHPLWVAEDFELIYGDD